MAWTDEMVEELKKMWHEGLTTGEIGKRLNVSKNSIVGKVHRLGLSGRPSPIKKKDEEAPAKPAEKKAAPASAAEPHTPKENIKEAPAAPAPVREPKIVHHELKAAPASAPKAEKHAAADRNLSLTDLDNHTCRWPLGDPKDENFHFCGKKVRVGQTYCDEHSAVAYVKPGKK